MKISFLTRAAAIVAIATVGSVNVLFAHGRSDIELRVLGTYATGIFDAGAAEIVAHDPLTQRLFVVNGAASAIDVLDIRVPAAPAFLFSIDVTPYGDQANSVDVHNGLVAAAVQANVKTDNGKVVFFDANGNFRKAVPAGALPDMCVFTPDGKKVLAANEGEPNDDYSIDPNGSVTIVDLSRGVSNATSRTIDFSRFNGRRLDRSVRIYGPNATVAEDLEPEYIAVSDDSKKAWVTLQENNAIAELDIREARFTEINGLGFKNHSLTRNGLDASDRDGPLINIASWPVYGMYQPDAIASFRWLGQTFLITANEGDAREYDAFAEEARVSSLTLDPEAFPDGDFLKQNANLGRLNVTEATGDFDSDGDHDALFALGGRSFSIWTTNGFRVYDSNDDLEQITAEAFPTFFNAGNTDNDLDSRSDSKGPEPEAVTVGNAYGRDYAFIGLERVGGILVYDISFPLAPRFVQYINNRNFFAETDTAAAKDLGPEGLHFIRKQDSPINKPLLVVANEISGTTTVYEVARVD